MWCCPNLENFWKRVTDIKNRVYSANVTLFPFDCILSYIDDLTVTEPDKVAVAMMLYMVRKLIVQY